MNKFFDKISITRYAAIPQNVPQEGIFWIKDSEFIAYTWQVTVGYEDQDCFNRDNVTYLEHRNVWKIDRKETVSFDYYPRGRVTVKPLFDDSGKFIYRIVHVYISVHVALRIIHVILAEMILMKHTKNQNQMQLLYVTSQTKNQTFMISG